MEDEKKAVSATRAERWIRWILFGLALALAILLFFVVAQYRALRRQQFMSDREFRVSELLASHAPLPASEASAVRTWMTFDYINKVFALPPAYLQAQLQITDARYPRLTLASYASATKLDPTVVLNQVESAIRNYPAPEKGTATSTSNAAATTTTSATRP
jgi:hypothetical protein